MATDLQQVIPTRSIQAIRNMLLQYKLVVINYLTTYSFTNLSERLNVNQMILSFFHIGLESCRSGSFAARTVVGDKQSTSRFKPFLRQKKSSS